MSFGAGVSIRLAGSNLKPMHHSAISGPYCSMRPVLSESSRWAQPEHRTCLVRSLPVFWIHEERCSVNPASARPQQTQIIEHDLIVLTYFGLQAHALDERHGRSTDVLAAAQPHDGQPPAAGQQRRARGRSGRAAHLQAGIARAQRLVAGAGVQVQVVGGHAGMLRTGMRPQWSVSDMVMGAAAVLCLEQGSSTLRCQRVALLV